MFIAYVFLGLVSGALIVALWARSQIALAADRARSTVANELLSAQERLAFAHRDVERLEAQLAELQQNHNELDEEMDRVRQQCAHLEVHAGRVPQLERQLSEATADQRKVGQELLQLNHTDGQKSRELEELKERLERAAEEFRIASDQRDAARAEARQQAEELAEMRTSLEAERSQGEERFVQFTETKNRLNSELSAAGDEVRDLKATRDELSRALAQSNEAKATLAEQTARVPELQKEVAQLKEALSASQRECADLRQRIGAFSTQIDGLQSQLEEVRASLSGAVEQRELALAEVKKQAEQLVGLQTTLDAERTQTEEKLALLNEAREQLGVQFQNLANQILEEKSQKFTQQNQANLGALLSPLQEKIKALQDQVAQTYDKDSKERLTLKNEIERLAALNNKISEDAVNLTQALKGSNKTQCIWGEMVLENVLESSGLRKGQEYVVQGSFSAEEGNQLRPDVVIYLPEGKHTVVDSKMSLLAYERYCNAETEPARQAAQKEHLQSLRNHIKLLSEKNYQSLHGLKSLDFVLMFVPVEPAFMLAVTNDQTLFNDAFAKNVLLVSPSTLLATLRTIANIWRQEHQNRNAQAIADQCAKLYDKFVGFVDDLQEVGKRIEQTRVAYENAHGKLVSGRGNLIGQVEKVKKLGVKPSKSLPGSLLDPMADGEPEALEALPA
jgi:DNA recombination protein RmuC